MNRILLFSLACSCLVNCGVKTETPTSSLIIHPNEFQNTQMDLKVITIKSNADQPIVGAQVLIGNALNSPFYGNLLTTNSSGQIPLPPEWNQALPITVEAVGFVRTTYLNQEPDNLTIQLHPSVDTKNQYEIKGIALDLPVKNGDNNFDFGLAIPAFSKLDLLSFSMDSVISPHSDHISAVGQDIKIPSNLSIPKQFEKYLFININLDKPTFRTYLPQKGLTRVVSLRGRLPFRETVDNLRNGKDFYDLINLFKLTGCGIRDVNLQNSSTQINIPSSELNFTDQKTVVAPYVRADETFLAVGVANQSGFMIPTDVKNLLAGQAQTLNLLPLAEQKLLAVVKRTSEFKSNDNRMSATLLPFNGPTSPKMLPLIENPSLVGPNELALPVVRTIDGVSPLAVYSVLSTEVEVVQGTSVVKILSPKWEVYAQDWVPRISLPLWPGDALKTAATEVKRWDVSFLGSQFNTQLNAQVSSQSSSQTDSQNDSQSDSHSSLQSSSQISSQFTSRVKLGPSMIEAATHVTHSSISY